MYKFAHAHTRFVHNFISNPAWFCFIDDDDLIFWIQNLVVILCYFKSSGIICNRLSVHNVYMAGVCNVTCVRIVHVRLCLVFWLDYDDGHGIFVTFYTHKHPQQTRTFTRAHTSHHDLRRNYFKNSEDEFVSICNCILKRMFRARFIIMFLIWEIEMVNF